MAKLSNKSNPTNISCQLIYIYVCGGVGGCVRVFVCVCVCACARVWLGHKCGILLRD